MAIRIVYLAMKIDQSNDERIGSDLKEFRMAATKLVSDTVKLGGHGFGTIILQWFASIAAIYLLILDRTNWKMNMLNSLLVPYIFLTLPHFLFHMLRGEVRKWIAFVAVVLQPFFPSCFPGGFLLQECTSTHPTDCQKASIQDRGFYIGCRYFQLGGLIAPFPQQGIGSIDVPPVSADTSNTSESIFYW